MKTIVGRTAGTNIPQYLDFSSKIIRSYPDEAIFFFFEQNSFDLCTILMDLNSVPLTTKNDGSFGFRAYLASRRGLLNT